MSIQYFLCFTLENQRFALRVEQVDRVLRAAEITPIPDAPKQITGVLNYHGKMILILNFRERLGLPLKELDPDDFIIISQTSKRLIGIVVNQIEVVTPYSEHDITFSQELLSGSTYIEGVIRLSDGVRLIQDIEKCFEHSLSTDEKKILTTCLNSEKNKVSSDYS